MADLKCVSSIVAIKFKDYLPVPNSLAFVAFVSRRWLPWSSILTVSSFGLASKLNSVPLMPSEDAGVIEGVYSFLACPAALESLKTGKNQRTLLAICLQARKVDRYITYNEGVVPLECDILDVSKFLELVFDVVPGDVPGQRAHVDLVRLLHIKSSVL